MKPIQHHHFKIYLKEQVQHGRHEHYARPEHNMLAELLVTIFATYIATSIDHRDIII